MPVRPRPTVRRLGAVPVAAVVAVALVAAACGGGGSDPAAESPTTAPTTTTTAPVDPVPDLPVVGGTDDEGQPLPPPVHAGISVVVAGPTVWWPWADPDRRDLGPDVDAISPALARLSSVLAQAGVPATVHLSSGVADALCEHDPGILDALERAGHTIGGHAPTPAGLFEVRDALGACGRDLTVVAGLDELVRRADGTSDPSTVTDAFNVLALLGVTEVVGAASVPCVELGLAATTHAYGTGAFTAPWRSGWTRDQPCTDLPTGQIVVVDHTPYAPIGAAAGGSDAVDPASADALVNRADQVLGYAADLRFRPAEELPAPGIVTWGITVRLDQVAPLWSPEPSADDDTADEPGAGSDDGEADGTDTGTDDTTADGDDDTPFDPVLGLAGVLIGLQPAVDDGRLVWVPPAWVGATLRRA